MAAIQARLKTARLVIALTGAGMSQESGLPTYRASTDGLWKNSVVSEVATRNALRDEPQKVWSCHQAFAQRIIAAAPNACHLALAHLEPTCPVTIVSQNLDDLHERAGNSEPQLPNQFVAASALPVDFCFSRTCRRFPQSKAWVPLTESSLSACFTALLIRSSSRSINDSG